LFYIEKIPVALFFGKKKSTALAQHTHALPTLCFFLKKKINYGLIQLIKFFGFEYCSKFVCI